MKFLSFVEREVDSFLQMQLIDLATGLSKNEQMSVEYDLLAHYDPYEETIFLSRFWDNEPEEAQVAGLKSDVFLYAFGHYYYTQLPSVFQAIRTFNKHSRPSFAKQWFAMCEQLRVMDHAVAARPGMKRIFDRRKARYRKHFQEKYKQYASRQKYADALLCLIYLYLTAENELPSAPTDDKLNELIQPMTDDLFALYETSTTAERFAFCQRRLYKIEALLETDCSEEWFKLIREDILDYLQDDIDALQRKDDLTREAILDEKQEETQEGEEDALPSWHGETSEPTQSFLQFDLDQGTNMNVANGDAAREAESGDQVYGEVQGQSKRSKNKQYDDVELLADAQAEATGHGPTHKAPYGEANRYARYIQKQAASPTTEEQTAYREIVQQIKPLQQRLKQTMEKTIEHKRHAPRSSLHWGRLDRKLLRVVTDDLPRVFYKKEEDQQTFDACFSLLVDCSSSMMNKMAETKQGIALFHETLKSIRVPHSVTGFWEDANRVKKEDQPNMFHDVIPFDRSTHPLTGPEILQLEPQEDNRDGFAIRVTSEQLLKRSEQQRFLLIFSDGEPAAADYDENGIMDTYQAVLEARKMGIYVIGVFLADGQISEHEEQAMQAIYGKHHLLVHDVSQLTEQLGPLLKKLLIRRMV
ncbi:nitric oxide reductase activation protein NorD [Caldalkalibacillus salinus]|uniref:nitric oxide reductase activation protein NorD n=1 Tax=Caldalkalibacillus salinus TaxID=2803787 RepID=UPI001922D36A|nr:hypothetical protein [Caldalkalibacillus salinus]